MHPNQVLTYERRAGQDITEALLQELSELYSSHYGVWAAKGRRPGEAIKLGSERIRALLAQDGASIAYARIGDALVGYAIAIQTSLPKRGRVTWVTQLVVHTDYRDRGIARTILGSFFGFSDNFAWGLVTANPYAVRALEGATGRRCQPAYMADHWPDIEPFIRENVPYLTTTEAYLDSERTVINTRFFVSHEQLPGMLARASMAEPWVLGEIAEGEEWLAFTIHSQPRFERALFDSDSSLGQAEKRLLRAIERMKLDGQHRWMKHTGVEVDFVVENLKLTPGMKIVDFGCGNGRHVLELARRGYNAVGVDLSPKLVAQARETAKKESLTTTRFVYGDCRSVALGEFDAAICLYDVIGSFPSEEENFRVLANLSNHLRPGGRALISVMSMELTEHLAKYRANSQSQLKLALHNVPPSRIMQETGDVFDPNHFVLDFDRDLVWRKEQFDFGSSLQEEIQIADMRYRRQDFIELCRRGGLREIWCRRVQPGRWDIDLPAIDKRAKEILYLGTKE